MPSIQGAKTRTNRTFAPLLNIPQQQRRRTSPLVPSRLLSMSLSLRTNRRWPAPHSKGISLIVTIFHSAFNSFLQRVTCRGHTQPLPLSFINDGICDCCDGRYVVDPNPTLYKQIVCSQFGLQR